jgi:hypothetical protein
MAFQIAYADGNLSGTGGACFKTADTASSLALVRNSQGNLAGAGSQASPSFTVTNGAVIDGVLLGIYCTDATPTGTCTIALQKSGVTQASVVVNMADLPHSATNRNWPDQDITAPHLFTMFKFTSTATGDGTANWTILITLSASGAHINYMRNSGTAGDFTRALRTSTTASPTTGDDIAVVGELTGAGTHNSRVITMDLTSPVQFGNGNLDSTSVAGSLVILACYGKLSFGIAASTNYILQLKANLEIQWQGTLDTSSSQMPRTSTGVIEMVMASAAGDFGILLRTMGNTDLEGLSPTSGKNVTKTRLTADLVGSSTGTTNYSSTNLTSANFGGLDHAGTLFGTSVVDNSTNAVHNIYIQDGVSEAANTTQTVRANLRRGKGTHNRYVRLELSNAAASITNGFYADIDLQAGTIGSCTAVGNGTAISAQLIPTGAGYVAEIVGKCSSGAVQPYACVYACAVAGTLSYAGDATENFVVNGLVIVNSSTSISKTVSINDDSGWLAGQTVCVAATSRTRADCQSFVLSANAGSNSFTMDTYPFGAGGAGTNYAGTLSGTTIGGFSNVGPGEVGLLSRNFKIRCLQSQLLNYFIFVEPGHQLYLDWVELSNYGLNATSPVGKYGFWIQDSPANTGKAAPKTITHCSLHDTFQPFRLNTATTFSFNVNFANNVIFNGSNSGIVGPTGGNAGPHIGPYATIPDWTFDNNLIMYPAGDGIYDNSFAGIYTNNQVAGHGGYGYGYRNGGGGQWPSTIGTWSNNSCHSGANVGLAFVSTGTWPRGIFNGLTAWHNNSTGLYTPYTNLQDVIFRNLVLIGNNGKNIQANAPVLNIEGGTISGSSLFSTVYGIDCRAGVDNQSGQVINAAGVDFSGTGTGQAAHTTEDIMLAETGNASDVTGNFPGCTFQATASKQFSQNKQVWSPQCYLAIHKGSDKRIEYANGQSMMDTAIYHTASPSQRLTPAIRYWADVRGIANSVVIVPDQILRPKLESAPPPYSFLFRHFGMEVPIANGATKTPSVWVRKSQASDSPSTWSPWGSGSNFAYSNGNLTAHSNSFVAEATQSSSFRRQSAGALLYAEFGGMAGWTNSAGIGIGNNLAIAQPTAGGAFGAGVGTTGVNGAIVYNLGEIWVNGTDTGININSGATITGHTVCMALNLATQKIWFRVDGGNWNGSGTNNPATGVGGIDISSIFSVTNNSIWVGPGSSDGQSVFIMYVPNWGGADCTVNFGASSFAQTVPSGFSAWDATGQPGYQGAQPRLIVRRNDAIGITADTVLATASAAYGTWEHLSGTTAAATDDGVIELVVDCDGPGVWPGLLVTNQGLGWINVDDWAGG